MEAIGSKNRERLPIYIIMLFDIIWVSDFLFIMVNINFKWPRKRDTTVYLRCNASLSVREKIAKTVNVTKYIFNFNKHISLLK